MVVILFFFFFKISFDIPCTSVCLCFQSFSLCPCFCNTELCWAFLSALHFCQHCHIYCVLVSSGNILLNVMLSSSMPLARQGKNNVFLVCVPNPPINSGDGEGAATPMLIKVKTEEDADELFTKIDERKKLLWCGLLVYIFVVISFQCLYKIINKANRNFQKTINHCQE